MYMTILFRWGQFFRNEGQFGFMHEYGDSLFLWKRIGVMVCKKSAYPNCPGSLTNCSGRLINIPEYFITAPEYLLIAPEHFRNCSGALS